MRQLTRKEQPPMKKRSARNCRFAAALVALLAAAGVALAGPPLVCHTFDVGSAKSLPWISHDWKLIGSENYHTSKLALETFAILAANPSVLVHMETLRRATLYARNDPAAAKELLAKLTAGTKSVGSGGPPALYYFDVGYLAETYKQWLGTSHNPAQGIDGYALVKQAIQLRGNDPEMEFAAALLTLSGPDSEHRDHVQKAMAGAKTDSLLAQNLSSHFMGERGETMAELLTKPAAAGEIKP
jgi:hypothetical protein